MTIKKNMGVADEDIPMFKIKGREEIENFISIKKLVLEFNCSERHLGRLCHKINDFKYCKRIKYKWYIRKDLSLNDLLTLSKNNESNNIS